MMQRHTRVAYLATIGLSVLGLGLVGCDSGGRDEVDGARISEAGVDGARFGDSLSVVTRVLGDYDAEGRQPTFDRTWTYVRYNEGEHAGLFVYFIRDEQRNPGPADVFSVFAPYAGATARGIGIGSSLAEVQEAYGEAEDVAGPYHFYCLGQRDFQIVVTEDSLVQAMHLGYHRPLGEGGTQYCL